MKKPVKKQHRRRRKSPALALAMTLAVLLGGFLGWMHLQARVTHLSMSQVYLPDLPAAMEDTSILFISDFKLRSEADAKNAARLMASLKQLQPDILVLGGDYCANGVIDALNGASNDILPDYAAEFIASLADFPAPMGKFAIAGDADGDLQSLAAAFQSAGISCLADSAVEINKNGAAIHLAGLSDRSLNRNGSAKLAQAYAAQDCVIVVAHNPAAYKDIRVAEAKGGGPWADLVLSGHTLGGQINILGRTLRSFSEEERHTLAGWFYPNDLPLLVSQGLGCDGVQLRLDSHSQIHLITLKKQNVAI